MCEERDGGEFGEGEESGVFGSGLRDLFARVAISR